MFESGDIKRNAAAPLIARRVPDRLKNNSYFWAARRAGVVGRLFFGYLLLAKQKKVTCRGATPRTSTKHRLQYIKSRRKPKATKL